MAGDCVGSNSNCGNSASNKSAIGTQSPKKANTTIQDRKLVEGVGYFPIFMSDCKKIELSTQGSSMRRTVVQDGIQKEFLYARVDDRNTIRQIELSSENWKVRGVGSEYGYIILEQRNAADKLTGYFKVVKKSKANVRGIFKISVDARDEYWSYYARRKDIDMQGGRFDHEI